MRLEVVQPFPGMRVLLDGERVDLEGGSVPLTGAPGDVRVVVLEARGQRKVYSITIGPNGPEPARVGPFIPR